MPPRKSLFDTDKGPIRRSALRFTGRGQSKSGRQRNEGFQSLTDDVGVRELRFVGENFPGRIEKGARVEG